MDLMNLRFGMFIHFSPTTYLDVSQQLRPDHAPPRQGKDGIMGTADDLSPSLLNPIKLDCKQWARGAKSAGMRFGVLTVKHHDGFCMWPSKYSNYTVREGFGRDVVKEFVEAFREQDLKVGFYYSIRDRTAEIADTKNGGVSPKKIQFIKDQLTELLTQYGPILYIVFDGWGNFWHESPTFYDIPFDEIYQHVKSLQPNCVVINHANIRQVNEVLQLELSAKVKMQSGSDWPAIGGDVFQGGTWFWRTNYPFLELPSAQWVVDNINKFNAKNAVFQLNCAPNRDGLMDDNVMQRLVEIGKLWQFPAPMTEVPASWVSWPKFSTGKMSKKNYALNCSAEYFSKGERRALVQLTDGDPHTYVDISGQNAWYEVDLGENRKIKGMNLWNRSIIFRTTMEKGIILISEIPFRSNELEDAVNLKNVTVVNINESVGFPTEMEVNAKGRYIRIVNLGKAEFALSEIEVY